MGARRAVEVRLLTARNLKMLRQVSQSCQEWAVLKGKWRKRLRKLQRREVEKRVKEKNLRIF